MGYNPLGWGGNIHGNRKENFIMGHDPLGWGGWHSWNLEEETLSWDTRGGGFGGPPNIGRREGASGGDRGREGGGRG